MSRLALVFIGLFVAIPSLGCRSAEPDDSRHRQQRDEGGSEATAMVTIPPANVPPANTPPPAPNDPAPQANEVTVAGPAHPALLNPALANETAPANYTVQLSTTKGDVLIDVTRAWAPIGADRFYNLVRIGAFNDVAFFRVIEGFMAQVGLSGDPAVNAAWRRATIQDDPPTQSNTRGMVSFATSGPNSRVQQFFVNFGDNSRLNSMGFAPFGLVRNMAVVDTLHNGYGEGAPGGNGPSQGLITSQGNTYLRRDFPQLDYIRSATIVTP